VKREYNGLHNKQYGKSANIWTCHDVIRFVIRV